MPPPLGLQELQRKKRKMGSSILDMSATTLAPSFQARDAAHCTAGPWMVEKLVEDITRKMGFQKRQEKPSPLSGHTTAPVFFHSREKKKKLLKEQEFFRFSSATSGYGVSVLERVFCNSELFFGSFFLVFLIPVVIFICVSFPRCKKRLVFYLPKIRDYF